jgi:hypothetical protein
VNAGEDRAAFIAGWRKLAGAMERDERVSPLFNGTSRDYALAINSVTAITDADALAGFVRSLGGSEWQQQAKRPTDGTATYLYITGRIDGLWVRVTADADKVCEPIEPQPVIERRCPALDAVIAETQEGGQS